MTTPQQPPDRAAAHGPEFWRSLEELAQTPQFQELLAREYPQGTAAWLAGVDRRQFLKLMGASLALAGLTGCIAQAPRQQIFPYVEQPEGLTPGRPLYFATAMPLAGYGQGLLVESHEGRPTKVEGNPQHPDNRQPPGSPEHSPFGPTDLFAQASILSLYDPDRAQTVTRVGATSTWDALVAALRQAVRERGNGTPRVRVLTETVTSPTLAQQLRELAAPTGPRRQPLAKWHVYEPTGRGNARAGAIQAFGIALDVRYHFERADVVLALDADFLNCGPGHVRYMREFCGRRRAQRDRPLMNRLYVVESTPSGTGAMADHRLPLRSGQVRSLVRVLANAVREQANDPEATRLLANVGSIGSLHESQLRWARAVARDLWNHHGHCLVIAGDTQPPEVHAAAHALNEALRNVGETVEYTDPIEVSPLGEGTSLRDLVNDMRSGLVDVLLILGGNPVYTAPADLNFLEALDRVALRIHLSPHADETAAACHWHVPEAHYLESWGDVRGPDGTVSILQPLIAPLYNGRTASELLGALYDESQPAPYHRVRRYWQRSGQAGNDFEAWWRRALHDGYVAGSALPARSMRVREGWPGQPANLTGGEGLEIVFRPDPTLFDGRFANNGWLQELPKPLTRLTWDNAALDQPGDGGAARLRAAGPGGGGQRPGGPDGVPRPHGAGAAAGGAGPRRRQHHGSPRPRPHPRWPCRHRRRLQRLCAAHLGRSRL